MEEKRSQKDSTKIISTDIKIMILILCPVKIILAFGDTNKAWRKAALSEITWSHILRRDFEAKIMQGWSAYDEYVYRFKFKFHGIFWQVLDLMNGDEKLTMREAFGIQMLYHFCPTTFSSLMLEMMCAEKNKFQAAYNASGMKRITDEECTMFYIMKASSDERDEFLGTPKICVDHFTTRARERERGRKRKDENIRIGDQHNHDPFNFAKLRTKFSQLQDCLEKSLYL